MYGYPVDSVRAGPEPGGGQPAEPPPHPRLRRLFALGGAAARTAESLARGLAALERIAREPDRWPLLDDFGGALVAAPDLAALFAGVAGDGSARDNGVERDGPVRAGRGDGPLPGGSLERPARPARPRVAAPGARLRRPAAPFVERTAATAFAGELLERTASAPGSQLGVAFPRPKGAAAGTTKPRVARPFHSDGGSSMPQTAPGVETTDLLRLRAERAGAPGAADAPVAPAHDASSAALLQSAGALLQLAPAFSTPHLPGAGGSAPADAGTAALMVRALERLTASAGGNGSRTATADRLVRVAPMRGSSTRPDEAASREADRVRESAPASGLRRLLAFRNDGELPPDSVRAPAPPVIAQAGAGVVEARTREAELAESLDRLLRREARRQGIDLEGGA